MGAKQQPKPPSTLIVDLGEDRYRELQDEAFVSSREESRRIPMTDIARDAIDTELKRRATRRTRRGATAAVSAA